MFILLDCTLQWFSVSFTKLEIHKKKYFHYPQKNLPIPIRSPFLLSLLSIMFSSFIPVVAGISRYFLPFMAQ